MIRHESDVVIRYIRTKNKTRKLATYRADDCALRIQHEKINRFLNERFIPSIFTKGYTKGRSIYHNAYAHMYNDYFIMMDIKNFFPHICHKQLAEKIYYEINLAEPNQISLLECKRIVDLCSISERGLPLGFITSPILSNIYLKEFDGIFYGQLKRLGLNNLIYTRYADDLTVSFQWAAEGKPQEENEIVQLVSKLLSRYGLRLNAQKTRSYNLNVSNHVRVTGVNITKDDAARRKLTVGRAAKNDLFWRAIACMRTKDATEKAYVKGMQSFILSIEKNGYESCYSESMLEIVKSYGFPCLKDMIDSF